MKFKIKTNEQQHSEMVSSLSWTLNNEVYSIGDDNVINKWDISTNQAVKFMDLENYSTDIDWQPIQKGSNDFFAIGFVDGSFKLITKLGKVDKVVVDAHKGALISLAWSSDGQALATAGEDGQIKTWSKTGNLRSQLVQIDAPIYCISWSPENDNILFSSGKNLYIKPVQAGQKQVQWKAHDGVTLTCDWNASNNLIISGGEDCKYKVWDSYGRLLFQSSAYDYVITSISWCPNGEYFAVGSYEMLKLCDKTGWTHSFNKTNVGSLMKMKWSADGQIVAGASGNGQVLFAQIIDKTLQRENWEFRLTEDNKIQVTDLVGEINEELDFKDRVINMSMYYKNLIVTTITKCYIYGTSNWNTPYIFDIKDKDSVSLIVQSPKYFCLVMISNGVFVYNYEGKFVSNPKIMGTKFEYLNYNRISLSQDILAVVDGQNSKSIKFYDIISGKQLSQSLDHTMDVTQIELNQNEQASERKIGFIDNNRDLYLSPVHKRDTIKLTTMTDSFLWNEKNDILAAISDGRLYTWYYPNAIYVDKDLMDLIKMTKESSDIGRMTQMLSFTNSEVTLRRKDGGMITLSISPYPSMLFDFCEKNRWEKAIKLCRFVKEQSLWACLAAISLYYRELNTAEIALAAIECVDKVQFINYVKDLPSEISRNAALALFFHKPMEAEQMLVQNKLYYRAIKLNIKLYRWERALELAVQFNVHIDTVVGYRKQYLDRIEKQEWIKMFEKYHSEVTVNWEQIKETIKEEKERESKLR